MTEGFHSVHPRNCFLLLATFRFQESCNNPFLINRLHDVSEHAREIETHGVRRGTDVTLAVAQVQTGHDLLLAELGFPMADDPNMYEELIKEFDDAVSAMVDIIPA